MPSFFSLFRLVLLVVVASLTGCVYFNTFYNAQVAYKTARATHQKLEKKAIDSITIPTSVQAGYDTAISKSNKVLTVFHKDEKWHDDALFLIGRAHFYKKEFPRAIRRFRQLQEEFPQSPFIPESYLYQGKSYLYSGNLNRAEEVFNLIEHQYPQLNNNQEISYLRAQVAIEREGKALAIELLHKVKDSVKDPQRKLELYLQIANLYIDMKQYEKAITLLQNAPRRKESPHLLFQIDLALSDCYLGLDSLQRALDIVSAMQTNRLYTPYLNEITFRKGSLLSRLGRFDPAITELERLTAEFPKDSISGEGWLRMGRIYQKAKGDFKKARECYAQALEIFRNEERRQVVQRKIDAIDKLMAYWGKSSSVDSTAQDSADAGFTTSDTPDNFSIAELFWLSLDEPDSAFHHYMLVAQNAGPDGNDSLTKAMYVAGWLSLHVRNDSSSADSILTSLIQRFPATEYAKMAQGVLGEDVTIRTREDSAMVKYAQAEKLLYDERNPDAAIQAFLQVHASFPDERYGAQALYAAAYIYDFLLEKNKSAFDLYRKVCKEYPDDELCLREAMPRLEIVSDSLRVRRARKRAKKDEHTLQKNTSSGESTRKSPQTTPAEGPSEDSAMTTSHQEEADSLSESAQDSLDFTNDGEIEEEN